MGSFPETQIDHSLSLSSNFALLRKQKNPSRQVNTQKLDTVLAFLVCLISFNTLFSPLFCKRFSRKPVDLNNTFKDVPG